AKATVPAAKPHDWGQSLRSFALGGPTGAFIDAVAQDRAQAEAHTEAVQIMNNVYSAPINDHRVAVPTYPPLAGFWTTAPCEPGRSPRRSAYCAGATTSTAAPTSWPTGDPASRRR
ncbi:MAG TPA: hypothetical protein VF734_06835, partial [Pseudonocardiaceae bacterium]